MSRRLSTDAKIVLERAGYKVEINKLTLNARISTSAGLPLILRIDNGTVDNNAVNDALARRGYGPNGYPVT